MTSKLNFNYITIKSETDSNKEYEIIFVSSDKFDTPIEITCNCLGYLYHSKCKHIDKYDPSNLDSWKEAVPYDSEKNKSKITKITIPSETDSNKEYEIYYNNSKITNKPFEIMCSCPGYIYRSKCKHIDKYDTDNQNVWKKDKKL